ncbi:MAG: nucleotidyltransferase domain-containing protein [candidate division WOR-3 bacterium]
MSVKVFRINSKKIIENLKEWAKKLSKDENIFAVLLFGSLAKGEETPASDADILIILKKSNMKFHERIPHFIPTGIGISVDVFLYTIEELFSLVNNKNRIIDEVIKSGIILYKVEDFKEFSYFSKWLCNLKELKNESDILNRK